jgi:hypothetical protein
MLLLLLLLLPQHPRPRALSALGSMLLLDA